MSQSAENDALRQAVESVAVALDARCPARIDGRIVACQEGHAHGCAMLPTEAAAMIRAAVARVIPPGSGDTP